MPDGIARPSFYEGQILAAADLQADVDHASGQQARHERYLHLWGIASGLGFTETKRTTAGTPAIDYVEVKVAAGVAIDGSGREIVLAADTALSESDFQQSNVWVGVDPNDTSIWYPVFMLGHDDAASVSSGLAGCGSSGSNRVAETALLAFGRPGDAADLDGQAASAVTDGPGSGGWKVLLGFVQWNRDIEKFTLSGSNDGGVTPRYAGVQADEVVARGGRLVLRSRPRGQAGAPAVVIDAGTGAEELRFGPQDAAGTVQPVFRVTAKGDVIAAGRIQAAATAGGVQVQSGTATDGMILPLPSGLTDSGIKAANGTVHVLLTPRPLAQPPDVPPGADEWACVPLTVGVDKDRRLRCLLRFFKVTGSAAEDRPGACDYLMMVTTPTPTPAGGAP